MRKRISDLKARRSGGTQTKSPNFIVGHQMLIYAKNYVVLLMKRED
jgi:hypothetical protein